MFEVTLTETARTELHRLRDDRSQAARFKAVSKAVRLLAENPRHPGLNTHEWKGDACPHGGKLWEAYAQNNTPGAYRIFFCYPPKTMNQILVVAITPHP